MFVECRTMTRRASQLITGNETGSVGGVGCLFSINHRIPLMTTFPLTDQTCWLLLAFFHLSRPAHSQGYRICFQRWKNEFSCFFSVWRKSGTKGKKRNLSRKCHGKADNLWDRAHFKMRNVVRNLSFVQRQMFVKRRADAERLCVSFGPRDCDGTFFNHMLSRIASSRLDGGSRSVFVREIIFCELSSLCGDFISGTMLLGGIKVVWESSFE